LVKKGKRVLSKGLFTKNIIKRKGGKSLIPPLLHCWTKKRKNHCKREEGSSLLYSIGRKKREGGAVHPLFIIGREKRGREEKIKKGEGGGAVTSFLHPVGGKKRKGGDPILIYFISARGKGALRGGGDKVGVCLGPEGTGRGFLPGEKGQKGKAITTCTRQGEGSFLTGED